MSVLGARSEEINVRRRATNDDIDSRTNGTDVGRQLTNKHLVDRGRSLTRRTDRRVLLPSGELNKT